MNLSDLVFCTGKRGRSKAEVRLSVNTCFQCVILHVWEKGRITHTFSPDVDFLRAMIANAQQALELMGNP